MSRSKHERLLILALSAVACAPLETLPASDTPQAPPSSEEWNCFYDFYAPNGRVTGSTCFPTPARCAQERRQHESIDPGTTESCQPHPSAVCFFEDWQGHEDEFHCATTMEHCETNLVTVQIKRRGGPLTRAMTGTNKFYGCRPASG